MSAVHSQSVQFPKNILMEKWFEIGFFWQGNLAISEMPRLCQQVDKALQQAQCPEFELTCRLFKQDNIVRICYDVVGVVHLHCHRCLMPMSIDISGRYPVALLQNAEEINQLEEDAPYVLLEELGGDGRWLPLLDLLEDELILALPLSAHHADCDMPVEFVEEVIEEPKENPFAVLAALKNTPS
ncbi:MAG: YceD family protein [Moraxella sp.]|nr:YceD family protein [Moraxella sp.]